MYPTAYSPLQLREVFHLEFLRRFSREIESHCYALKGGVNLRFFFKSIRYSEDMDIDIHGVGVQRIKKTVMDILASRGLSDSLLPFGIEKTIPPDINKAKQTDTTQRFKIHLLTTGKEDLFTKIEFSRRERKGNAIVETIPAPILRYYRMPPLLAPHYDVFSAVVQKIHALAQRAVLQARDIFDLFILSSQCAETLPKQLQIGKTILKTAHDNIFLVDFARFKDTVVAYLNAEDQILYSDTAMWDEVKLTTARFLDELKNAGL